MMLQRADMFRIAGAVVAILLQVVLAPNIALFGSFPNIPLVYVLVLAVVRPESSGPAFPFVVGLACDLLGSGPVGAMALLFMVPSVIISQLFQVLDKHSMFMPLASLFFGLLAVEVLYGFLLVGLGLPVSPLSAFVNRAAPCALYDFAVAMLLYPPMLHLLAEASGTSKNSTPHVKLR